jgi:hypothetical protein
MTNKCYPTKSVLFRVFNAARKAAGAGKIDQGRLNRALGIAQSRSTQFWVDGKLDVPSRSKPGRSYTADWRKCDCPDKRIHRSQCEHNIAWALLKKAWDTGLGDNSGK